MKTRVKRVRRTSHSFVKRLPDRIVSQMIFRFAIGLLAVSCSVGQGEELVLFSRDVRPILADKCFHCHGPDGETREAELRLDVAIGEGDVRGANDVVVANDLDASELQQRIITTDVDLRMPPPESERQLTAKELSVLRRWIEQGGEYESHWAFAPPLRPPISAEADVTWSRNAIDHFVQKKLAQDDLLPSQDAERTTLLRRVTLDLTGVPPTIEEIDAFLADDSPNAYEKVVDQLLASPRFGERMALVWLDAARFADSGGYQGDILRSMWLWRDWVINAYNGGMPFDQFTIEQLAGDLLPNPTIDQRIATGFNRNHRINDEDGIVLEEFRVEYVVDRIETTATVWLGLTLGCARCHDHKYDPVSQVEFYQLFAYFNSIEEEGRGHGNSPPLLKIVSASLQEKLDVLDQRIKTLRTEETPDDKKIAELQKQRDSLAGQAPNTMVMQELPQPRETFVLVRGAYNRPSDQVVPGLPQALTTANRSTAANRLGLARWIVAPENPLTGRVAVNRYWQMYFGRGIVATPEDFGTQGALPSNPLLLDWLATEFLRLNWDIKALQREIVTSATYRQSSAGSKLLVERDPLNRLLARGPRFRLPVETIRDQALAASGILHEKIGGPSVRPYQPKGLWNELASASRSYEPSQGADLYRRSLYTFIRRTVPPPAMTVIDAPNREICVVRRPRTNTPLQALVVMNDPTFVEAARVLAERTIHQSADDTNRIRFAFRSMVTREPSDQETETLRRSMLFYRERYKNDAEAANKLLSVGESTCDEQIAKEELAAYTSLVMLILNLDETLTKE
jgi:Protein of unknown function (DUF1553)/Protein of unknown function (DUF1549)/Planctomycete cytochrome C